MTLNFTPDPTIQQTLTTISGLGQIMTQENRVTRETKPKASSTEPRQTDPDQISDIDKQGLVFSSVSGTPRQPDIANKTSVLHTTDPISNQILASSKHADIANQTTAVPKTDHVSNPISNSSTQSNTTSNLNTPAQMSDTATSSAHQMVHVYQPSTIRTSDQSQVIRVKSSKRYSVKIKRDLHKCCISGICATATGDLLITDWANKKVKLLDQTYKVVADYKLPGGPRSMFNIDSSLVAIAVNIDHNSEVHFIRVTNRQLVQNKLFKLQHNCTGIAHHKGNLYIVSGTTLYHYFVDGRLVSKLYEDTAGYRRVAFCAVSQEGDRIYVLNLESYQLITLSRDGKVISKLTDPALTMRYKLNGELYRNIPSCLYVTDSGQVLVFGANTDIILQVDSNGRQRLAEVDTTKDGVTGPTCVYYSKHTGILIVVMCDNDDIVVFSAH